MAAPGNLRKAVFSLGVVNALDMVFQVVMPMVLVRVLNGDDFGLYRMMWLIAGTALSIVPMAMPASLLYFLPRHEGRARVAYLAQAAWFMLGAGIFSGAAAWLWLSSWSFSGDLDFEIALFVALWVFASLLDVVFNAQQKNTTQALVNAAFSVIRFASVVVCAIATRSIEAVVIVHLVVSALKALFCAGLVTASLMSHKSPPIFGDRARWPEQLIYAAPFGGSTGVYLLLGRIDQWLVASLFSPAQYGVYSIAAIFSPVQGLIRNTINNVVLPELNRLQAAEDLGRISNLNRRGNLAVALVMFPFLTFLFSTVGPVLEFLFTHKYSAADNVVRMYCLLLLIESIEVTTLMIAYRQGPYLFRIGLIMLPVAVLGSIAGAKSFGLTGAAVGGVAAALVGQFASYRRCAHVTGLPVAELQDWPMLLRILMAAIASSCASAAVVHLTAGENALQRLILCGAAAGLTYWLGLRLLNLRTLVSNVFGHRLARLMLL